MKLAPGLKDLMPLLVALAVLLTGESVLDDSDTGWHVRTGELILTTGTVPRQDPYSFSAAGQPWFAWEWLSDIGMALLHRLGGLSALVAASAALLGLSFALAQRLALALGARPFATFCLVSIAATASTVHWLARPHVLSYLMLPLVVGVLEAGRPGRSRALLGLLVPLTLLWCNLHGGFVVGLLVCGAYLAGSLLPGAPARWRPLELAAVLGLATAATVLNPYGLELHAHLASYLDEPAILRHIDEFQAPDFQTGHGRVLELWLAFVALAIVVALRRRDWPRVFVLAGLGHMTLTSHRHVDLLAAGGAPLVCALLAPASRRPDGSSSALLERLRLRLRRLEVLDAGHRGLWGPALTVLLAVLVAVQPGAWRWGEPHRFPESEFPVQAAQHLAAAGARRVLSTDSYGGYLIYCCWPQVRVFVDGRSDFYVTTGVFEDYLRMLALKPGWLARIEAYDAEAVLLPRQHRVLRWLLLVGGWAPVHADATAALLVRRPDGSLSQAESALREALVGADAPSGR